MRIKNSNTDSVSSKKYMEQGPKQEVAISGNSIGSERWNLRACPRCHGDMYLESEIGDTFYHCLLCGFVGLTR
jgi:predicted  nucleic acid-binding Zn ribbon protein